MKTKHFLIWSGSCLLASAFPLLLAGCSPTSTPSPPDSPPRQDGAIPAGQTDGAAAYERTVLSGNAPYDQFRGGDENALTAAQKRGLQVFDDAGCSTCHMPPLFSNDRYYNTGVGQSKQPPDEGRKAITGDDADRGKFRVPALREVADRGPYFHDDSASTLEAAVAVMAAGGIENDGRSAMMRTVADKQLSEQDRSDLVEFLKALSGAYPIVEPPDLP